MATDTGRHPAALVPVMAFENSSDSQHADKPRAPSPVLRESSLTCALVVETPADGPGLLKTGRQYRPNTATTWMEHLFPPLQIAQSCDEKILLVGHYAQAVCADLLAGPDAQAKASNDDDALADKRRAACTGYTDFY